jgi:hypothetical protein
MLHVCINLGNTMPAKSKAQAKLMQAAAHNPKVAKAAGVPQKVAREYVAATGSTKNLPKRVG